MADRFGYPVSPCVLTLEQFIRQEQAAAEEVLVEKVSYQTESGSLKQIREIVEAHHPIPEAALPIMRKIWAAQYEQWQQLEAWKTKSVRVQKITEARKAHAGAN